MKNKTLLVIGGTGFLGFHLCNFFKKKGWKIYSLSKKKPVRHRKVKSIKYLFGDISKLKEIKFLKKLNIKYLINCGGYVDHFNKM